MHDDDDDALGAELGDSFDPSPLIGRKPPLGSGERFRALEAQLAARGARDPAALAAWIGRRKYGARRFAELATAGRARRR